jgi:DNA polymerase
MPDQPDLLSPAHAAALVAWYDAMGVDVAVDEAPVDRLAPPRATPARAAPPPHAPQAATFPIPSTFRVAPVIAGGAVAPSDETARTAQETARASATLADLREALARFEGCNLRLTATQLVFADGNPESRVMLVGEAPGREEDLQGLPFVGRSGQLLDRMLRAIGLDRTSVYIANVLPWRPPGNRDPAPHETAMCLPFLKRQIELVDPDFLVLLGKASAQTLLETTEAISRLRGRWRDYDTGRRTIRALATFHPAYLLRNPLEKRRVWRDFLMLKAALDGR